MLTAPVDSRQYRFPYEINALSDAPADFDLTDAVDEPLGGLFLPRDDQALFTRSTPPRVLLLEASRLTMFSHPQAAVPPVVVPLAEIDIVESGHALLIGWIRILHRDSTITLPYNTRSRPPVERFLSRLRSLMFSPGPQVSGKAFGPELDIKFRNARQSEIDDGELIRTSFFQPPAERPRRFGLLSFRRWAPGDFIALTDRRVLWISDRIRSRYDRYGLIARYGRPVSLGLNAEAREILLSFQSGRAWHVPLRAEWFDAARSFAGTCRRHMQRTQLDDGVNP